MYIAAMATYLCHHNKITYKDRKRFDFRLSSIQLYVYFSVVDDEENAEGAEV